MLTSDTANTQNAAPQDKSDGEVGPATAGLRTLLISHTAEEGTVLTGTTRADDVYKALRSQGWLFRRSSGDYLLQASKNRPMKRGPVTYTADWLTEHLGVTVLIEQERGVVAAQDAEADLAAAAEVRADRLERRAARLEGMSQAAHNAAEAVFDAIPFGQPLLVGHHSYKADRNRRDRAWRQLGRSYELGRQAALAEGAAATAGARMTHRHNPVTVANRIDRLTTERRRIERLVTQDNAVRKLPDHARERVNLRVFSDTRREDLAEELAHLIGQIDYWTSVRAEQIRDGVATNYSRETVKPGDVVKIRGRWHYVARVNAKTVAVPHPLGLECTQTTPWHEVQNHIAAGDADGRHAQLVRAFIRAEQGTKFGKHAATLFPALTTDDATGGRGSAGDTNS